VILRTARVLLGRPRCARCGERVTGRRTMDGLAVWHPDCAPDHWRGA
jgi:hypothetical protein